MSTVSIAENVAENLRRELARAGMSQAELSRRTGATCATINKILQDKMEPSLTLCERLARGLGVPAASIFLTPDEKTA